MGAVCKSGGESVSIRSLAAQTTILSHMPPPRYAWVITR
jgi:hypothetical protein